MLGAKQGPVLGRAGEWCAGGGKDGLPAQLQAGRILQVVSQLLLSAIPTGPRGGSWQVERR